jgi:hypothetical protein
MWKYYNIIDHALCTIFKLFQCYSVNILVKWNCRQPLEYSLLTSIIVHEVANNPGNFAIAKPLSDFNMGKALSEVIWVSSSPGLG